MWNIVLCTIRGGINFNLDLQSDVNRDAEKHWEWVKSLLPYSSDAHIGLNHILSSITFIIPGNFSFDMLLHFNMLDASARYVFKQGFPLFWNVGKKTSKTFEVYMNAKQKVQITVHFECKHYQGVYKALDLCAMCIYFVYWKVFLRL